jgi:hypothetical protein
VVIDTTRWARWTHVRTEGVNCVTLSATENWKQSRSPPWSVETVEWRSTFCTVVLVVPERGILPRHGTHWNEDRRSMHYDLERGILP